MMGQNALRHNELVIVLATSKNALELSEEDLHLMDCMAVLGIEARLVDWTDPDFDWRRASLVAVRTTWDYHLRLPEFLAWVDRVSQGCMMVNAPETLRWNANKRYLRQLSEANVPIVPTVFLGEGADVVGIARDREWPMIVAKPAVAAGAYETLVFDLSEAAEAAQGHVDRLATHGEVLLQPYLDAITVEGETSLVFFDGEFSHAVRKVPAAGDFRVQIEHGGRYSVVVPTPEQLLVADLALRQAPAMPTYARVDLVDIGGLPHLMELELIEPELFFLFVPEAAMEFADLLRDLAAARR